VKPLGKLLGMNGAGKSTILKDNCRCNLSQTKPGEGFITALERVTSPFPWKPWGNQGFFKIPRRIGNWELNWKENNNYPLKLGLTLPKIWGNWELKKGCKELRIGLRIKGME